ncbi:MAG: YkyA family protein, partial [Macrococcoides caseolyticum]
QGEIKGYADQLLKNADDRRDAIEEEVKAMDKSKGIYEDAKAMTKDIKDETQKKQVASFIATNDKKYTQHQQLMDSYKDILRTEKEVFTYLKQPQPKSKVVNDKIENVTKKYEQFKKDTTAYANTLRAVEQEKTKMTDILNGK